MFTRQQAGLLVLTDCAKERVGLLPFMNAETRQEIGRPIEACAGIDEPKQKVPVHRKLKGRANAANGLVEGSSPEQCLLGHIVKMPDGVSVMAGKDPAPDLLSDFIDNDTVTIDDVDMGMHCKELAYESKGSCHQQIIRIEISHSR